MTLMSSQVKVLTWQDTICNLLTLVLGQLQECRLHFLMQFVKKCNYNQIKIKSTIFKMIVEFFELKVFLV